MSIHNFQKILLGKKKKAIKKTKVKCESSLEYIPCIKFNCLKHRDGYSSDKY